MRFFLTIASSLLLISSNAQQKFIPRKAFTVTTENDAYLFQIKDAYYTNGIKLNYRIADTSTRVKRIHAFELGQKIFTPLSKKAETTHEIDRPYCGYLYADYRSISSYRNDALLQWGLTLGLVGKASLGEALQNGYHSLLNFKKFEGWKYQVPNALGIDLTASYAQTLFNLGQVFKMVPVLSASLGTQFTNAKLGTVFCIGSYESNHSSLLFNTRMSSGYAAPKKKMELFLYVHPSMQAQVYNASLQGGLFSNKNGAVLTNPETWVFEQEWGICYAQKRFNTRIAFIHQSKETAGQLNSQSYGSIQMGVLMF